MSLKLPRGLSLEQKLPLWISALLLLTLVGSSWAAYEQVKRSTIAAATQHLRGVARQLAGNVATTSAQRYALMRRVAADSAVRAVVRPGRPARPDREAPVRAALAQLAAPFDSFPVAEVRDSAWVRRAATDPAPPLADVARVRELARAGGRADSARMGLFYTVADSVFFWTVAPVREGGATVGYVVHRRRLASPPETGRQIRELTGTNVTAYVADTTEAIWTSLAGTPVVPPRQVEESEPGLVSYDRPGGQQLAAKVRAVGTPWLIVLEVPQATILERPRTFLKRLLLAAALISVVGAAAAWAISRSVTGPLGALTTAAGAIAAGDYGRRVSVDRGDEIGQLGTAFNTMAGRVADSHDAMERQAAALRQSNEELAGQKAAADAARTAAEAARVQATAANKAKSDFLAVMSHEIRTPINAMIGYAQLIELGLSGPVTEVQQRQLERVRTSGTHLLGLVNEVLDLAKAESGALDVGRERAVAADTADAALVLTHPQAAAKGVRIAERCGGARDLAYVGDEQRVRQIVANLLSNAVKFTNSGGRVAVSCAAVEQAPADVPLAARGPWACIRVEDSGIGIARADLASVFEPFVQVDRGLTRSRGGTGLGLSVSRHLARLMGGDVTAESEPGVGSCFTLWLPAAPELAGAEQRPRPAAAGARAADDTGLADLGHLLLGRVEDVARAFAARLRAEAIVPHVDTLTDPQLQDHTVTFLADVAQSFLILQAAAEDPADLVRDSSDIQRVIAERHGGQRYRLGWTEGAVTREFAILAEEAIRVVGPVATDARTAAAARAVLTRSVEQAARVSVQAFQRAEQLQSV